MANYDDGNLVSLEEFLDSSNLTAYANLFQDLQITSTKELLTLPLLNKIKITGKMNDLDDKKKFDEALEQLRILSGAQHCGDVEMMLPTDFPDLKSFLLDRKVIKYTVEKIIRKTDMKGFLEWPESQMEQLDFAYWYTLKECQTELKKMLQNHEDGIAKSVVPSISNKSAPISNLSLRSRNIEKGPTGLTDGSEESNNANEIKKLTEPSGEQRKQNPRNDAKDLVTPGVAVRVQDSFKDSNCAEDRDTIPKSTLPVINPIRSAYFASNFGPGAPPVVRTKIQRPLAELPSSNENVAVPCPASSYSSIVTESLPTNQDSASVDEDVDKVQKLASLMQNSTLDPQRKLEEAKLILGDGSSPSPTKNSKIIANSDTSEPMDEDKDPWDEEPAAELNKPVVSVTASTMSSPTAPTTKPKQERQIANVSVPTPILVAPVTPRKALNILLLGETGVGKSTFINSFANYVNHDTLSAARSNMLALIPSSFSLSDDNYVDHTVSIGSQLECENERLLKGGQSSTQSCRSYVFPSKHGAIRIIDTPGVGDTRGLEQDSLNFDEILSFISQYPDLNAICILLKPNSARLTAGFRMCLNQLLNNLEKSASQNIVFLFTNARSTFFMPGDTKPVLEKLLLEVSKQPPFIQLKFDRSNSFCVDNESFRFLAAISNGLDFLEVDTPTFEESWVTSVAECKRLMDYITTLKPHNVQGTVSINEARRLINQLGDPVADILLEMSINMTRIQEQKEFLEQNRNTRESLDSLKSKMVTKEVQIFYEQLLYPRTVCASEKCVVVPDRPDGNVEFTQICHAQCYLQLTTSERCGDPNLQSCLVFHTRNKNCTECGCSWQNHMRISHLKRYREVQKEDIGIKALLQKATTIDEAINVLNSQFDAYKKERKLLVDIMAFFTVFQNVNAITGRGDPFRDILTDNLRFERYKNTKARAKNDGVIKKLELILTNYDGTKKKLTEENNGDEAMKMNAENVLKYEKMLYKLPLNGENLRQLRAAIQNSMALEWGLDNEKVVEAVMARNGSSTILESVDSFFASNNSD